MDKEYERYLKEVQTYNPDEDPSGAQGLARAEIILTRCGGNESFNRLIERNKANSLERNLAKALYLSIVERGFSLDDYPDVIKDVLREAGHKKIDIKGEDTPISKIKREYIINYAEGLLRKYNFPTKPTRF